MSERYALADISVAPGANKFEIPHMRSWCSASVSDLPMQRGEVDASLRLEQQLVQAAIDPAEQVGQVAGQHLVEGRALIQFAIDTPKPAIAVALSLARRH